MKDVNVYTDGACRGNPGPGAWALAVYDGTEYKGSQSSYMEHTTNNEAEMTAIFHALEWAAKHGLKVRILTDSAYCKNGLTQWMHGWYKKGWRKSDGAAPENLELWKKLYDLYNKVQPEMVKVKGHSNVTGNLKADALCNVAMDEHEFEERFNG